MKVSIDLSDDQVRLLETSLRRSRFANADEAAQVFVQLAVEAWLNWLSGSKRYTSLTDQYSDWIEQIYIRLLPDSEPPTVDRLYNCFNVPYGQARYIAQVLNNKTLARWRAKAINDLKSAMEKKLPKVDEIMKSGDSTRRVEITIDRLAFLELRSTWERLFEQDPNKIVPPDFKSAGNVYVVLITAICFREIYAAIGS